LEDGRIQWDGQTRVVAQSHEINFIISIFSAFYFQKKKKRKKKKNEKRKRKKKEKNSHQNTPHAYVFYI
jgi:uncharacterized membrane protein